MTSKILRFQKTLTPKYVRVMADFGADGLWDSQGRMSDCDIDLPDDIGFRLDEWQTWFSSKYDCELDDRYLTEVFKVRDFADEGLEIARDLKIYLGDAWTVVYFDAFRSMVHSRDKLTVNRTFFEYEIICDTE